MVKQNSGQHKIPPLTLAAAGSWTTFGRLATSASNLERISASSAGTFKNAALKNTCLAAYQAPFQNSDSLYIPFKPALFTLPLPFLFQPLNSLPARSPPPLCDIFFGGLRDIT